MSIERVIQHFEKFGMQDRVMQAESSSATVALAAETLGTIPARIAKTLAFKRDDSCILVVLAGDTKIDNKKFKQTFGMKASMLSAEDTFRLVGHEVGGVCPFGIDPSLGVYLDYSLKRFDTVFPACGSSNSMIELSCDELYRYSGAEKWVDVGKI